jgi:hypothetical protein
MNPGFCDYKVVISCDFGSRTSIADEIAELSLPKTLSKLTRGLRRNQNIIAA